VKRRLLNIRGTFFGCLAVTLTAGGLAAQAAEPDPFAPNAPSPIAPETISPNELKALKATVSTPTLPSPPLAEPLPPAEMPAPSIVEPAPSPAAGTIKTVTPSQSPPTPEIPKSDSPSFFDSLKNLVMPDEQKAEPEPKKAETPKSPLKEKPPSPPTTEQTESAPIVENIEIPVEAPEFETTVIEPPPPQPTQRIEPPEAKQTEEPGWLDRLKEMLSTDEASPEKPIATQELSAKPPPSPTKAAETKAAVEAEESEKHQPVSANRPSYLQLDNMRSTKAQEAVATLETKKTDHTATSSPPTQEKAQSITADRQKSIAQNTLEPAPLKDEEAVAESSPPTNTEVIPPNAPVQKSAPITFVEKEEAPIKPGPLDPANEMLSFEPEHAMRPTSAAQAPNLLKVNIPEIAPDIPQTATIEPLREPAPESATVSAKSPQNARQPTAPVPEGITPVSPQAEEAMEALTATPSQLKEPPAAVATANDEAPKADIIATNQVKLAKEEEPGLFDRLKRLFTKDETIAPMQTAEEERGEEAESNQHNDQIATLPPASEVAPLRDMVFDSQAWGMGSNLKLGAALTPMERQDLPCFHKTFINRTHCIRKVDWPKNLRTSFNSGTVLYNGTKAIIGYDQGRATRLYALFAEQDFEIVVAHFQKMMGTPHHRAQRKLHTLKGPHLENDFVLWHMGKSTSGDGPVTVEIRRYDDIRQTFPDTKNGVVRIFFDQTLPLFKRISPLDFISLR